MKRVRTDASLLLLGIIVLLLGGGAFFVLRNLRSDPIEEALSQDRVINTLFIIEKEGKPLCSYVLFYYPATKRAAVFDIPGEVGLIISRINRVDRIDTLYDPQRISVFEGEIGTLLGIDINNSVILTMENLGRLVDLIEGVELFIPVAVEIYGESPILFPSGITRLDGDKAQAYIIYELPEEEPELIQFRRQRFFLGLIKSLGEKNEILKTPRVARLYHSLMKTTMTEHTRSRLFDEYAGIDTDRVGLNSIGGTSRVVSGQTLLFPSYDGNLIKEIVRQTLGSLTRQVEGAISERVFTIEVLNGTTATGLAGRTAELLRGFGYDVISIGNADRNDYEKTEIIDRSGHETIVNTFAEVIRCKNIRQESPDLEELEIEPDMNLQNFEYKSDFTLILGRDFNGRYVTDGQ
ncbi:MAG: LCP family protein [Spirochaetaceae bacterium]|jgi:anionic cell wall polymer biosynthesis LytR-Cps2A-Psr (LCP) family protein|nr:LCP family protein [Spirochaetaceae bacterium]